MRENGRRRRRRRRRIARNKLEPHIVMWGTKHANVGKQQDSIDNIGTPV